MSAEQWNLASTSSYKAAPKFSFTHARDGPTKKPRAPGPGHYNQTTADKDKFKRSASWVISSTRDGGGNWFQPPGPGAYSPGDGRHAPKWVFSSEKRLHELPKPNYPGPGKYEASPDNGAVKSSISHKPDAPRPPFQPGPGAYKPGWTSSSQVASEPKIGFGTSSRSGLVSSKTPGPGTYELHSTLNGNIAMRSAEKYSISSKYPIPQQKPSPGIASAGTQFK
jgi:hypothetical protein